MARSLNMVLKSEVCFSKKTGKALSSYKDKEEAERSAKYIKMTYDSQLSPYECNICDKWHLSPKSRHTPSRQCYSCTDRKGKKKELYESEKDAQRRADILHEEQGVYLQTYECPHEHGWHLTKG